MSSSAVPFCCGWSWPLHSLPLTTLPSCVSLAQHKCVCLCVLKQSFSLLGTYTCSQSHNRDPSKCTSNVFLVHFSPQVSTNAFQEHNRRRLCGRDLHGSWFWFLAPAIKAGLEKSPRPFFPAVKCFFLFFFFFSLASLVRTNPRPGHAQTSGFFFFFSLGDTLVLDLCRWHTFSGFLIRPYRFILLAIQKCWMEMYQWL